MCLKDGERELSCQVGHPPCHTCNSIVRQDRARSLTPTDVSPEALRLSCLWGLHDQQATPEVDVGLAYALQCGIQASQAGPWPLHQTLAASEENYGQFLDYMQRSKNSQKDRHFL